MASRLTRVAALSGLALGALAMVVPWARGDCNAYWNRHHCQQGTGEAPMVLNFWDQSHWIGDLARASTVLLVAAVVLSFMVLWQVLMHEGRNEAGRLAAIAGGILYLVAGVGWIDGVGQAGFGIFLVMAASAASFLAARGLEQRLERAGEPSPAA